jgi:hypothetical protein
VSLTGYAPGPAIVLLRASIVGFVLSAVAGRAAPLVVVAPLDEG